MEFPITIRMPTEEAFARPSCTRTRPRRTTCTRPASRWRSRRLPPMRRGFSRRRSAIRTRSSSSSRRSSIAAPRRGAGRRARRAARAGAGGARGDGRDPDRLRRDGAGLPRSGPSQLDASAEVLDIRSLKPLDEEAILASRRQDRPRRRSCRRRRGSAGFGAEIAAVLAEKAILDLRAPDPPRHRLRRAVSVLVDRGRVHADAGARRCGAARRLLDF